MGGEMIAATTAAMTAVSEIVMTVVLRVASVSAEGASAALLRVPDLLRAGGAVTIELADGVILLEQCCAAASGDFPVPLQSESRLGVVPSSLPPGQRSDFWMKTADTSVRQYETGQHKVNPGW